MEVRRIRKGEERAAAAVVYEATRGAPPSEAELSGFLSQAATLGTELTHQVVAVMTDGTIKGCAVYFPMSDGTATATLPLCVSGFDCEEVQIELMRGLKRKAAEDGVAVLLAFGLGDDARAADILTQSGYEELALMLVLERDVSEDDRNIRLDKEIRWTAYAHDRHDDFACVVEATYEGTLDCPKLGEVRNVSDVLAAYRGEGTFDPSLWLLADVAGEHAACLLLRCDPAEDIYELTYLGVVPTHRGKGLGRKVMQKGLSEIALRSPRSKVTLEVDSANDPAVDMYFSLGFRVSGRKQVFFTLLATPEDAREKSATKKLENARKNFRQSHFG